MTSVCYSLALNHKIAKDVTRKDAISYLKIIFQSTTLTFIPKKAESALATRKKEKWQGTSLNRMSASDAINYLMNEQTNQFPMGRWPDPILRVPSILTPSEIMNTSTLYKIGNALRETARSNKAVGLAAQQCGIEISLIYLDSKKDGLFLVNPRFIERSSESKMKVWTEECLVLPPDFHATVLRDLDIIVEAEDLTGQTFRVHLYGEQARAMQHECDHDRGILITDHVGADEMKDEEMWLIEKVGHDERQQKAYVRYLGTPTSSMNVAFVKQQNWKQDLQLIQSANAVDNENVIKCDDDCKKRIEERRAIFQQSRSNRNRREVFDLSKQRAALYNTTYQGSLCIGGLPCY